MTVKSQYILATLFSFLLFSLAPAPPHSVSSQGKKPGTDYKPAPPATKTKLEAQEFSKEFATWVKTLTITSADKLTFRWFTDEAEANGGVWKVSDKPVYFGGSMATAMAAQPPHVISSGNLSPAPSKGKFLTFEIDFANFAPKNPPAPRTYWVFVTPSSSSGRGPHATGLPSVPVKITYRRPSLETAQFPECFNNPDCSTGYYCGQGQCQVVGYVCDGHVVKGSDGSSYECSPYICQAGQCQKTCNSIDDCVSPYVCNSNYKCVSAP